MPLSPNNIPGTVQIHLVEDTPQDSTGDLARS